MFVLPSSTPAPTLLLRRYLDTYVQNLIVTALDSPAEMDEKAFRNISIVNLKNTSLVAPRALAHRLQCRTTCKIYNGRWGLYMKNISFVYKYQPGSAVSTHSPPATPHRLQHLTAHLIQNGRQGLERSTLGYLTLRSTFAK